MMAKPENKKGKKIINYFYSSSLGNVQNPLHIANFKQNKKFVISCPCVNELAKFSIRFRIRGQPKDITVNELDMY